MEGTPSNTQNQSATSGPCLSGSPDADPADTLQTLLHRMVHDLRAPLRAMAVLPGWITEDLAADATCIPNSVHRHLDEMANQAMAMDKRLHGFARYLNATLDDEPARICNTGSIITQVIREMPDLHGAHVVGIHPLPHVFCPAGKLATAVAAILDNAARLAGDGGHVCITGQSTPPRLVFRDDGPGIDPAIADDMFDPFVAFSPSGPWPENCGMGLAVAAAIIHGNGGRISVDPASAEGGTTFTVELPAMAPVQTGANEHAP